MALQRWLAILFLGLCACGGSSYGSAQHGAATPAEPQLAMDEPPADVTVMGGQQEREEGVKVADIDAKSAPPPAAPPAPGPMAARSFQSAQVDAPAKAPPPPVVSKLPAGKKESPDSQQPSSEVAAIRGPMLIYTADITMAVFEVNKSLLAVEVLGRDAGGFLAKRTDNSITIRVPVAKFDEVVKRIEKVGDMLHKNVVAEDVTEEFRDLEVRLKSARAVRDRLEQLLAKAVKVEESIAIERELDRIGGEIDRIEGRMKFLRDRAAYSTVTVTFTPKTREDLRHDNFHLPAPWLNQLGLQRLLSL